MSRLLLVRHGLTVYNSTHRFSGYSNIELSKEGYQQVENLRDYLANEKIDIAYSSDLKRALVTAEVICTEHNVEIITCPELREANYGEIEGLTFQEISQNHPEVADLVRNFDLSLEFPGGETFLGFIERTITFLDRLDGHKPSETILIVSHSGPLRTLACHLMGIGQNCWWQLRFDNASLSIIDTYPRGAILTRLNDVSHLRKQTD